MGILSNAFTISCGGFIGSLLKRFSTDKFIKMCGICLIILSLVGFLENVFEVDGISVTSDALLLIVLSLLGGYIIGSALKLEKRFTNNNTELSPKKSAFLDSTLFFSIGGLQITGSILLALEGDSSMLYLKSLVDLPFAIILGSTLGKTVSLSAIPVAVLQVCIFFLSKLIGEYITPNCIKEICAVSYVILFFSGYNLLVEDKNKFGSVNMLPSVFIIIIIEVAKNLIGR